MSTIRFAHLRSLGCTRGVKKARANLPCRRQAQSQNRSNSIGYRKERKLGEAIREGVPSGAEDCSNWRQYLKSLVNDLMDLFKMCAILQEFLRSLRSLWNKTILKFLLNEVRGQTVNKADGYSTPKEKQFVQGWDDSCNLYGNITVKEGNSTAKFHHS